VRNALLQKIPGTTLLVGGIPEAGIPEVGNRWEFPGNSLLKNGVFWEFPGIELELIQTQMAQKPMLRAEVGMRVRCANKASAE
jgi:hypothetical protein